jgi:3'-phosphoadenosine 5'-phosphosulfate sulfotransferase (PAPS reductase)/FAD synthetase
MKADNPYLIHGPAVIAFSGGRTSGYMLHEIIVAHGGQLPANVIPAFANTGKERTETLDFVHEIGQQWNVNIVWLEWQNGPTPADRYRIVSHNSASRNGEPFKALIDKRGFLPNPMMRYCTQHLKIATMQAWARNTLGWKSWTEVIGLRADEPGRAHKAMDNPLNKRGGRSIAVPLFHAGIEKEHVLAFWKAQPFDLQLRDWEGNCDLCFLKGAGKITRIMQDRPDLARWWQEQEQEPRASKPSGARFRVDRPSYTELLEATQRQGVLPMTLYDDYQSCDTTCTD